VRATSSLQRAQVAFASSQLVRVWPAQRRPGVQRMSALGLALGLRSGGDRGADAKAVVAGGRQGLGDFTAPTPVPVDAGRQGRGGPVRRRLPPWPIGHFSGHLHIRSREARLGAVPQPFMQLASRTRFFPAQRRLIIGRSQVRVLLGPPALGLTGARACPSISSWVCPGRRARRRPPRPGPARATASPSSHGDPLSLNTWPARSRPS